MKRKAKMSTARTDRESVPHAAHLKSPSRNGDDNPPLVLATDPAAREDIQFQPLDSTATSFPHLGHLAVLFLLQASNKLSNADHFIFA